VSPCEAAAAKQMIANCSRRVERLRPDGENESPLATAVGVQVDLGHLPAEQVRGGRVRRLMTSHQLQMAVRRVDDAGPSSRPQLPQPCFRSLLRQQLGAPPRDRIVLRWQCVELG
jgi:hypothetical protein